MENLISLPENFVRLRDDKSNQPLKGLLGSTTLCLRKNSLIKLLFVILRRRIKVAKANNYILKRCDNRCSLNINKLKIKQ